MTGLAVSALVLLGVLAAAGSFSCTSRPGAERLGQFAATIEENPTAPGRAAFAVSGLSLAGTEDYSLLLDMLAALLSSGSSLPGALGTLGRNAGIPALSRIASLLLRGVDWRMAWDAVLADGPEGSTRAHPVGAAVHGDRAQENLGNLADLLAPSWRDGTAAAPRLRQAARLLREREEDHLEQDGSVLSVRVLMPVGLCFLPALIVLGVMPVIASFAVAL